MKSFVQDFFIQDSNIEKLLERRRTHDPQQPPTNSFTFLIRSLLRSDMYCPQISLSLCRRIINCFVLGNKEPSYIILFLIEKH